MMKLLSGILLVLVFGLFLTVPTKVCAQIDAKALQRAQQRGQNTNLYGNNPYAGDEEEGEDKDKQDTTKKKRRIRKPLESYFFNDSVRAQHNFMWNIDRDFNRVKISPIDTTLDNWHIDYPIYRKGVGDVSLGALGQSSLPLNYFDRPQYFDFDFASTYSAYTYDMENAPFFNVKKPMIHFTYMESGQKKFREENFNIMHAQNISPSTGFNIDYKSRGTRGQYDWSRTKNHNLSVGISHTGKRYSVHAGFINNHIEQQENGGVVGDWAIADTSFQMPSGVPMKLAGAKAQNTYRNNVFYIKQSYGIPLQPVTEKDFSIADLSAVFFGHSFEYNAWSKVYTDQYATYTNERGDKNPTTGEFIPTTGVYYKNWYINPLQTRDSISERLISNRFFVQAQPWDRNGVVGTIDGGLGIDMHTYAQFTMNDYLSGEYTKVKQTSYFVYGSIAGKIKKYVDWGADLKFYPS
ncbi:MAG: putative porin, partial [Alistipes sp.]